jgi:hypothetical protein
VTRSRLELQAPPARRKELAWPAAERATRLADTALALGWAEALPEFPALAVERAEATVTREAALRAQAAPPLERRAAAGKEALEQAARAAELEAQFKHRPAQPLRPSARRRAIGTASSASTRIARALGVPSRLARSWARPASVGASKTRSVAQSTALACLAR